MYISLANCRSRTFSVEFHWYSQISKILILFFLYTGVGVNIDSPKIVSPPIIINQKKTTPQSLLTRKWLPQGDNGSPKKCYKVMGSSYLPVNIDSPETIIQWNSNTAVKFELCNKCINHNLGGSFRDSFWGGERRTITPCLKPVRIMLETSNLARKYSHICSFRTKALLIVLMSAFFAKNQRFLTKIVTLLKAIVWELC